MALATFMELGPTQRYVLLGDPLSLVCGRGLDSNPQADVVWTAPDGMTISDNARYDLENGPDIVRLNSTHTVMSDTGVWRCIVSVRSDRFIVSEGRLVRQDQALIGSISVNVQVIIIGKLSCNKMTGSDYHHARISELAATTPKIL